MIYREEQEQIHVFQWAKLQEGKWPELRWMFHIPNGGKRSKVEAARFKAAGVKAGVPDICLPVPRGGYHGLYIELKASCNRATARQNEWLDYLCGAGYRTQICHGFEETVECIKKYLEESKNGN